MHSESTVQLVVRLGFHSVAREGGAIWVSIIRVSREFVCPPLHRDIGVPLHGECVMSSAFELSVGSVGRSGNFLLSSGGDHTFEVVVCTVLLAPTATEAVKGGVLAKAEMCLTGVPASEAAEAGGSAGV